MAEHFAVEIDFTALEPHFDFDKMAVAAAFENY